MFAEIKYRIWGSQIPPSIWNEQVKLLALYLNQTAVALLAVGVILPIALPRTAETHNIYLYVLVFVASIILHHGAQFVLGKWMQPSENERKEAALQASDTTAP